jgi:hypothetical protein
MKFYYDGDIIEGEKYPLAWIVWSRILPWIPYPAHKTSAPVGRVLMLRLPWWVRKEVFTPCGPEDRTCQLVFMMHQFIGPEKYGWIWLPDELRGEQ